jgi:hypothetical protein
METMQFEALKVALKQDKTGYVLTLCMHPDDIPTDLLRDFVGARYQVVMVRLNGHENPMTDEHDGDKSIRAAGILCRDKRFWKFLHDDTQIISPKEADATEWLREYLGVQSRSELKIDVNARKMLEKITKEYREWSEKT